MDAGNDFIDFGLYISVKSKVKVMKIIYRPAF